MIARVWLMTDFQDWRPMPLPSCVSDGDRRWWLVEAVDERAARKVIEHFEHNGEPCVHGRVIANGGKR